MNFRQIRCYKVFAEVSPGVYNYPVYCISYDGWSNISLATCINCGELFAIDWENPLSNGLNIEKIASSYVCPKCGVSLKDTIRRYPETLRLPNGNLGSFTPAKSIPSDDHFITLEVFELLPK